MTGSSTVPRRRRHCLAVDYNTANPALHVAALAQNATDEPVEATSEIFLLEKRSTTCGSTPRGPKESNTCMLHVCFCWSVESRAARDVPRPRRDSVFAYFSPQRARRACRTGDRAKRRTVQRVRSWREDRGFKPVYALG